MTGGSQNLRIFRRTIRDGATIDDACKASGIEITEARLTISADAKNPPPPEAFELIGHNKGPDMAETTDDRLRLLIERVERLEEEKKAIADDIKDVYGEGKSVGYDAKLMREIVKLRKMKPDDRRERDMLLDVYKAALGMDFCETPLGTAALRSVG